MPPETPADTRAAGVGRPLRAFALLGLGLAGWFGWRVSVLLAAMQAPPLVPAVFVRSVAAPTLQMASDRRPAALAVAGPMPPAAPASPGARAAFQYFVLPILPPIPRTPTSPESMPTPILTAAYAPTSLPESPPLSQPASPPVVAEQAATLAYAALATGDRRAAAQLFARALAAGPDPRAAAWQRARRQLLRRWAGDAWTLLRDPGPVGPAASPVLGGGQSGASVAYTIDPLARRPLAVVARLTAASDGDGAPVTASTQAGFGLRWRPRPGLSLSAERLVAVGRDASDDWTLRVAGGGTRRRGRLALDGYAEAGALAKGPLYAGGQMRLARDLLKDDGATLAIGVGAWGSVQGDRRGGTTLGRFDLGPAAALQLPIGATSLTIAADWRFRLAGNAAPGSGPSLTVAVAF